jgi:hypothetical protein
MKIRFKKPFAEKTVVYQPGEEREFDETKAKAIIKKGFAEKVELQKK